jgi:hypothetical protein
MAEWIALCRMLPCGTTIVVVGGWERVSASSRAEVGGKELQKGFDGFEWTI